MILFLMFLLSVAHMYNSNEFIQNSKDVVDNLFYDDAYLLKDVQNNFKNEIAKQNKLNENPNSKIKNFYDYYQSNKKNFQKFPKFTFAEGKCTKIYNIQEVYKSNSENVKQLQNYLNERNFIFTDEFENLLIYSSCNNLFDSNCLSKMIFVNKINFEYYELTFTGVKIPKLTGYAINYVMDEKSFKKLIYLTGGIDSTGAHNKDLYRMEVDYNFGIVNVSKMMSSDDKVTPVAVSELSLNVLSYTKSDKEK